MLWRREKYLCTRPNDSPLTGSNISAFCAVFKTVINTKYKKRNEVTGRQRMVNRTKMSDVSRAHRGVWSNRFRAAETHISAVQKSTNMFRETDIWPKWRKQKRHYIPTSDFCFPNSFQVTKWSSSSLISEKRKKHFGEMIQKYRVAVQNTTSK